jgi:hypothetical protein
VLKGPEAMGLLLEGKFLADEMPSWLANAVLNRSFQNPMEKIITNNQFDN